MIRLFLLGFCLLATGLAEAKTLHQYCVAQISVKPRKTSKAKVCDCVLRNFAGRADALQLAHLERIYSNRRERWMASKDPQMAALLEMDAEFHRQCLKNPMWTQGKEDMGEADPL